MGDRRYTCAWPGPDKTRRPMILVGLSDRSPRSLAMASSMCYSSDGRISNRARSSGTPMSVLTWRRRCSQPPWTGRRRPSSDGSGLRQGETLRSAGHPDHPAFSGDAPFVHVDAGRQPGATARKLFSDLHHVRRSELQAVVELIRGPALDPDRLRFWRNCWARSNRLAAACCCVALHEESLGEGH